MQKPYKLIGFISFSKKDNKNEQLIQCLTIVNNQYETVNVFIHPNKKWTIKSDCDYFKTISPDDAMKFIDELGNCNYSPTLKPNKTYKIADYMIQKNKKTDNMTIAIQDNTGFYTVSMLIENGRLHISSNWYVMDNTPEDKRHAFLMEITDKARKQTT